MVDPQTTPQWQIGCPNPNEKFPWILYKDGIAQERFASYGSAFHAMEENSNAKA
jgi:hypothetical protein